MVDAYIAVGYHCNENCHFCPCNKSDTIKSFIPINDLICTVDNMAKQRVDTLIISGGEPTVYPYLPLLLQYVQKCCISAIILSNSERFSESEFINTLVQTIDLEKISVITTLHSHLEIEHEQANGTIGSFDKTLAGLKNLIEKKTSVIIKHCITKQNLKYLFEFYKFIDRQFPESINMQLCSIDYCGVEELVTKDDAVIFPDIRKSLEEMLDYHITRLSEGSKRKLVCYNLPLCSCDPYYWRFFAAKSERGYSAYFDPDLYDKSTVLFNVDNDVDTDPLACKDCKALHLCPGTYKTAFKLFGKALVKPFIV